MLLWLDTGRNSWVHSYLWSHNSLAHSFIHSFTKHLLNPGRFFATVMGIRKRNKHFFFFCLFGLCRAYKIMRVVCLCRAYKIMREQTYKAIWEAWIRDRYQKCCGKHKGGWSNLFSLEGGRRDRASLPGAGALWAGAWRRSRGVAMELEPCD